MGNLLITEGHRVISGPEAFDRKKTKELVLEAEKARTEEASAAHLYDISLQVSRTITKNIGKMMAQYGAQIEAAGVSRRNLKKMERSFLHAEKGQGNLTETAPGLQDVENAYQEHTNNIAPIIDEFKNKRPYLQQHIERLAKENGVSLNQEAYDELWQNLADLVVLYSEYRAVALSDLYDASKKSFFSTQILDSRLHRLVFAWAHKHGLYQLEGDVPEFNFSNLATAEQIVGSRLSAQVEQSVILENKNVRRLKFFGRLKRFGAFKPKIAGTEKDMSVVREIKEHSRTENGTAHTIVYGPPGTGKTEFLRNFWESQGFETRVISIHKHTDAVQLFGEAAIPIQFDQGANKITKLEALKSSVTNMTESNVMRSLKVIYDQRPGEVAAILPESYSIIVRAFSVGLNPSDTDISQEIESIRNELIAYFDRQIFMEGFSKNDPEQAKNIVWGEIVSAWKEGKIPILDEVDKAEQTAFDSISALLAFSPGTTISFGGVEYTIPDWAAVDMSANSLNLPPHISDRFGHKKVYLGYPDPADMMQKATIFLTEGESGLLPVSPITQEHIVSLVTYFIPEVQGLYQRFVARRKREVEDRVKYDPMDVMLPFSMRGVIQMIQDFRTLPGQTPKSTIEIIRKHILAPGVLAPAGTVAHDDLLEKWEKFEGLFIGSASPVDRASLNAAQLTDSPIYDIITNELPLEYTKGSWQKVQLSAEHKQKLLEVENTHDLDCVSQDGKTLQLANGLKLILTPGENEKSPNTLSLVGKTGNVYAEALVNSSFELMGADRYGKHVVFKYINQHLGGEPQWLFSKLDFFYGGEQSFGSLFADKKIGLDRVNKDWAIDSRGELIALRNEYQQLTLSSINVLTSYELKLITQPNQSLESFFFIPGTRGMVVTLSNRSYLIADTSLLTPRSGKEVQLKPSEAITEIPYSKEWKVVGHFLVASDREEVYQLA